MLWQACSLLVGAIRAHERVSEQASKQPCCAAASTAARTALTHFASNAHAQPPPTNKAQKEANILFLLAAGCTILMHNPVS